MALKHVRNYSTVWAQSLEILDDAKPISFATGTYSHTEAKKKQLTSYFARPPIPKSSLWMRAIFIESRSSQWISTSTMTEPISSLQ